MPYYSAEELKVSGLAAFGEDVRISKMSAIYNPERISVGNHVRIDDFCVLSAGDEGIEIGDYVHIAVYCSLIGMGKIKLNDFCNLSSRVSIYSSNDDYTGKYLTNPTVPVEFTGVDHDKVIAGKHVIIGSGSVVLPGVCLNDGVAVGALSLVTRDCQAFGVYGGVPARRIGERKRDLLVLEAQLRQQSIPDSGDK